jgi:perosamine synthetase
MIPIYKPYLPKHSLKYAHDAIDSTWISSKGIYIEQAKEYLEDFFNVNYVQLVNSGTSATHLLARALLYKHPEIKNLIVPNNVYIAAWNPFVHEGFNLIPIDADIDTWNFNIDLLPDNIPEDTAVLVVHNLGNIINVSELKEKYNTIVFVEDNCEGFGGRYGNQYSGTDSLASSLSFFGNKNITSGEGGAFLTNDEELYECAKLVHGQGQSSKDRYIHNTLAFNYRMTNIQAALLLGQLEMFSEIKDRKEVIFEYYRKRFSEIDGVEVQKIQDNTSHSNWMMGIRITGNGSYKPIRDSLIERGVDSRPIFYPMSFHSHLNNYSNAQDEYVSCQLSEECLMLPSFPELSRDEQDHIIISIENYIKAEAKL